MSEKITIHRPHEFLPHPQFSKAYIGWYKCRICGKEHYCRILPATFPMEDCDGREKKRD